MGAYLAGFGLREPRKKAWVLFPDGWIGRGVAPKEYGVLYFWIWCLLFQKTGARVIRFTQIYADKRRGLPCIGLPKSVRQRQRSCLFERDLRSLWQTDFATPGQLDPRSSGSRRFTRTKGADERGLVLNKGRACFWVWCLFLGFKRLDPGSTVRLPGMTR
jgi:hypothetical protein